LRAVAHSGASSIAALVCCQADNDFNQKATDALLNFETVKYFNAEEHEELRYDAALQRYSHANIRTQQTLAVLNAGQQLIIVAGVGGVMILASKQVVNHDIKVGDFVMLFQFILTLYQPLGFLGTYYRMIKQSMLDVEAMLLLWRERPDIRDAPDARDIVLRNPAPSIEFRGVNFAYGNKVPILRNINFTVGPGKKVAIVGASGAGQTGHKCRGVATAQASEAICPSHCWLIICVFACDCTLLTAPFPISSAVVLMCPGKSTLARLLYRFYDVSSGSILVDGQDVAQTTQRSLRDHIAIVPQDTVRQLNSARTHALTCVSARRQPVASRAWLLLQLVLTVAIAVIVCLLAVFNDTLGPAIRTCTSLAVCLSAIGVPAAHACLCACFYLFSLQAITSAMARMRRTPRAPPWIKSSKQPPRRS